MAFWTYMLRCSDGRYYTGHTDDLDRRLAQHRAGGFCDFTSRRLPVELVWSESFPARLEALEAERVVGGWSRGKKEALIRGEWSVVSHLARPPKKRGAAPGTRFSTLLETNGGEKTGRENIAGANDIARDNDSARSVDIATGTPPFVSSEVEKRAKGARP